MRERRKRQLRVAALRRTRNTCVYCSRKLPKKELSLEHLQPRSQGGSNALWNLVCSCIRCNMARGTMELQAWLNVAPLPMFRTAEDLIAWADEGLPRLTRVRALHGSGGDPLTAGETGAKT